MAETATRRDLNDEKVVVFCARTVGDVKRLKMLYLITRMLYNLKLDIRITKIGTKGDQIADVFYVRDFEGQKIEDKKQVSEIKSAMLYQFERRVSPGFHPYSDSLPI